MAALFPSLPPAVNANLGWIVFGLIVVFGLFVYGLRDVLRFSGRRVWAIGGVCFSDAVRRRVLWVAPLAMLGAVVVGQLINPTDEQDAVRQTIKYCLFATGLVVVVVSVILGCTTLPREIENKVIFTVVTKPVTRLEIILGKIAGLARVAWLLLLIMGGFSLGYLYLKAWTLQGDLRAKAQAGGVDPAQAAWLAHYEAVGLLGARTVAPASDLQVYAVPPADVVAGAKGVRWLYAGGMSYSVPFELAPDALPLPSAGSVDPATAPGFAIVAHVPYRRLPGDAEQPTDVPVPLAPVDPSKARPEASIQLLDENGFSLPIAINGGKPAELTDPDGATPVVVPVSLAAARKVASTGRFMVRIVPNKPGFVYGVGADPVELRLPRDDGSTALVKPVVNADTPPTGPALLTGMSGRRGAQVPAPDGDKKTVGVYRFAGVPEPQIGPDGRVPMELEAGIQRLDEQSTQQDVTELGVSVRNAATGAVSPPQLVYPESGQTVFFSVPADAVKGGTFDVLVRSRTPGHTAELTRAGLEVVTGRHGFALNFLLAMLALWLLAILVSSVAVFASTFVSWPIAVTVTLILLLCNWAVTTLSDSLGAGAARGVTAGFFTPDSDPAQQKVVEDVLDVLIKTVRRFGDALPDIGAFGAGDYLQQGEAVPPALLGRAALVLVGFGVPLVVLAYIRLRNKEVAP